MGITLINGVPLNAGSYLKDQDIVINKNQPQLVLNRNDNTTENIIAFNTAAVQKWQIATSTLNEQYLIIYGLNNNGLYLWRFDQTNGLLQYYDGVSYHTFWHDGNFQPSNYVTLTTFNSTITGLSTIFLGINATAVNSTKWNNLTAPANPGSIAFLKMAANGTISTDTNTYVTTAGTAANSTLWNNQSAPANPASVAFLKMAANGTISTDTNTYITIPTMGAVAYGSASRGDTLTPNQTLTITLAVGGTYTHGFILAAGSNQSYTGWVGTSEAQYLNMNGANNVFMFVGDATGNPWFSASNNVHWRAAWLTGTNINFKLYNTQSTNQTISATFYWWLFP